MASLCAGGQVEACALARVAAPVRFSTLTPEAASAFVGRPQALGCQRPASTKLTKDVSSVEDSARRDLSLEFSNGCCYCTGRKELLELWQRVVARRAATGLTGRPQPGGPRAPLSCVSISASARGHGPYPTEGLLAGVLAVEGLRPSPQSPSCTRTRRRRLVEGNGTKCEGEVRGLEARRGGSEKKNIY